MSKKILVCDDDRGILDIIRIMLEGHGYEVLTLNSGRGIIKKVKQYLPDVILLDIWMPGIDGKEITKILKRDQDTKNISIVVVSALNETEMIAKEIGADNFLTKPFDMDTLLQKVGQHISTVVNK